MLLRRIKNTVLIFLVGLISCTDGYFDKNTLALVPVENIQLSFDLIDTDSIDYKKLVSSKGNVFEIKDLPRLRAYVLRNQEELLLSNNYSFLWDTLEVPKNHQKLYLIDYKKTHPLIVKSVNQGQDNTLSHSTNELLLTPKSKSTLSAFFAANIGRGLVLVDKNGFVVSAEKISRLDNGNLLID